MERAILMRSPCFVANALGIDAANVKISSLATTLSPWEIPPLRVATLILLQTPSSILSLNNQQNKWVLEPKPSKGYESLLLDTHF